MKKLFTVLFMFLSAIMVNLFASSDVYASDQSKFEKYYKQVLIPQYAKFKKKQNATLKTGTEKWLKITGVIGASIMDFDGDGKQEMMVLISEPQREDSSQFYLQMYEIKKGKVTQTAKECVFYISTSDYYARSLLISTVKKNNKIKIIVEEHLLGINFSNGQYSEHYFLEYKKNKFHNIAALSQTQGESSGFAYTYIKYKNDKIKSKTLFYDEISPQKAKYNDYTTALIEFYKANGLSAKKQDIYALRKYMYDSVIPQKYNPVLQFCFSIKCVKGDYFNHKFKYKSIAKSKNDF